MLVLPSGLVGVTYANRFPDSWQGMSIRWSTMKTLRHKRLSTTAEKYTHHVMQQQNAQGLFLKAIGKTEGRTKRKKKGK
jgi:hypothetical protein